MSAKLIVNDGAWRKIYNTLRKAAGLSIKTGVLDGELAEIAAANEYGTENSPPRPFVRQTFELRRGEMIALQAKLARAMFEGKLDERRAMELLGAWAAGAIKATITRDGSFAPLAKSTIAAKGSSKPLINTGQMLNSVTFVVVP